jgi:HAD superfamily hydrolase (TIGR01509 family)
MGWFEHTVVSGELGIVKPDRRIFEHAIERCRLEPARSVLIDDMPANVEAARACGFHAVRFTTPEALRADLAAYGLL